MRHPPVRLPLAGCMTLNVRVTPASDPARPSLASQHVRLGRTPDPRVRAEWEAHVDAGRIGVAAPPPAAGEYGLASLQAILGRTRGGVW